MHAQAPLVHWIKTYGPNAAGWAVQQTTDGGYIIVGEKSMGSPTNWDIYVIRTDSFGDTIWTHTYNNELYNDSDFGYSLDQTPDSGYIIAGKTNTGAGRWKAYLVKVTSNGVREWHHSYGTIYDCDSWCVEAIVENDTTKYVTTGQMNPGAWIFDVVFLSKLKRSNNQTSEEWRWYYGSETYQPDCGYSVQQTADSGYIITGKRGTAQDNDVYLIKTDAFGDTVWLKTFGGAQHDCGRCVQQTTDGGYIVAGYTFSYGAGNSDMYLIKTDASGDTLWTRTFGGMYSDTAFCVRQTAEKDYIIVGSTYSYGAGGGDVYVIKTDSLGNKLWDLTIGGTNDESGHSICETADGNCVIAAFTESTTQPPHVYLVKIGEGILETDDPLSLAYNSNRHFVRKHNSYELHLVYTASDRVCYSTSTNAGQTWQYIENLGTGAFPSICLATDNLPVVTWTDDEGGLWYSKQTASGSGNWSTYHLYDPAAYDPYLNTPPSIAVTRSLWGDTVHILASLFLEDIKHLFGAVVEYAFPISNPNAYTVNYIEGGSAPNHKFCYHPSLTKDYQEQLHAVWQRADTICYATREVSQNWNNWGPRFGDQGLQSSHPFVETYGDSVFVVWQHLETSGKEDVYRAARHIDVVPVQFDWQNLSYTQQYVSLYPVNASGLVTTFADEEQPPPPDGQYEIYWKRIPDDPLNNISTSPRVRSIYPHTSFRYNQIADDELFVIWQEGNISPYRIECTREYITERGQAHAFFTSANGFSTPSPYVTARDTFISRWTVPVDIGYETVAYRFMLEPGFLYKATATLYHETSGQWQGVLSIDNALTIPVQYHANVPQEIELWIPPALYEDGVIELSFNKVSGAYAAMGQLCIYRYESETGKGSIPGGPMAYDLNELPGLTTKATPTLFTDEVHIELNAPIQQNIKVNVYDITGRLVNMLHHGVVNGYNQLTWDGTDLNGTPVSRGIYFIRTVDLNTNECRVHKVLKVR
jgi:hypothetical protein